MREYTIRPFKSKDMPLFCAIINKVGIEEIAKAFTPSEVDSVLEVVKGSVKDGEDIEKKVGLELILRVVGIVTKNFAKCQIELNNLLFAVTEIPVDELNELDLKDYFQLIKDVLGQGSFSDFFTAASGLVSSAK